MRRVARHRRARRAHRPSHRGDDGLGDGHPHAALHEQRHRPGGDGVGGVVVAVGARTGDATEDRARAGAATVVGDGTHLDVWIPRPFHDVDAAEELAQLHGLPIHSVGRKGKG